MPRSRRPHRYPTYQFKFISTLEARDKPLTIPFPSLREALSVRRETYSFIRALELEADLLQSRGELAEAAEFRRKALVLSRWTLTTSPPYNKASPNLDVPATLTFTKKDYTPLAQHIESFLDAETDPPSSRPPKLKNPYL